MTVECRVSQLGLREAVAAGRGTGEAAMGEEMLEANLVAAGQAGAEQVEGV